MHIKIKDNAPNYITFEELKEGEIAIITDNGGSEDVSYKLDSIIWKTTNMFMYNLTRNSVVYFSYVPTKIIVRKLTLDEILTLRN